MAFPPQSPQSPQSPGGGPASGDDVQKRVGRKLQKKRRDELPPTLELPEPLRDSDSDEEASPDDAAPARAGPMSVNMNQSIFGLIAAAGSRVDFHERFDDGSSDDDDAGQQSAVARTHGRRGDLSQTAILRPSPGDGHARRGHKRLSGHRLLRSLATLPTRKNRAKRESSRLSAPVAPASDEQSESSEPSPPPAITIEDDNNRLAPVMSRMLQARAEMSSRPSFDLETRSAELSRTDDDDDATPLAKRLMEIFQFDEPEQVVEGT